MLDNAVELFVNGATLRQSEGDAFVRKSYLSGQKRRLPCNISPCFKYPVWPQAAPPRATYMQAKAREVYVPPVLQDLRAGTAELHIALEKRLPFFSDTLDTPAFVRLMQAYYGFYLPLENALINSSSIPPDFDLTPRLKAPTLRADLQALGLTAEALGSLPQCDHLPVIESAATCLGVLYVLEGRHSAGKSCAGKSPAGWAWKPKTALLFSISMAPPRDVAGAISLNIWALDRWMRASARPWLRPHKPHSAVSSVGSKAGRYWHDSARQRSL